VESRALAHLRERLDSVSVAIAGLVVIVRIG
jgi:hypothetical protein